MSTVIFWVLATFTVLGGIAAIVFFLDKWKASQRWDEDEKLVTSNWWESSDLKAQYQAEGYNEFGWSNPDRLAERLENGKEIVFEKDTEARVKYRLVNQSGQVLICRKNA